MALALVLILAGFSGMAVRQGALLTDMDEELQGLAAPARQSAQRVRAVYDAAEHMTRLGELRAAPGVARIWEELARLVPTTTFLTEVEVGSRFVQLSGLSASAPELIKILEGSVLLQDVSFAGPIVLDAAAGKERFTLRASLRQVRDPVEERG
jgi:hypothetical protein